MKKVLKIASIGVLSLLVLFATSLFFALRGSLPQLEGEIASTVSKPVTVTRDSTGLVSLSGGTRDDIGYVLGYLHAQERFFQMDLLRRSSAGELSALFGAKALPMDRERRLHRFRSRARDQVAALPAKHKALLGSYTTGVNAGLNALSVRPFEYLLLRDTPQPWQPEDTLLIVVAMYFDLQSRLDDQDYSLTRMAELLDEDWYNYINARGGDFDASLFNDPYTPPALPSSKLAAKLPQSLQQAALHPEAPAAYGSNNWAVSGAHTEHGGALIANDMHLGLRLPHIWFRAGWTLPDGTRMDGLTLPGTPLVVAGTNGNVAWGFTNSYVDTVDILRLRSTPDGTLSTVAGTPVQTTTHTEVIKVKGGEDVQLDVVETPFGPVVGKDEKNHPLVFQWTAHSDMGLNMNTLAMEQIKTVEQALADAPSWGIPTNNLVVGDSTGSIGWIITGPMPVRAQHVDGISETPWQGYSTEDARPRLLNPPSGRIWTANARVVDQTYHETIGSGGYALGARSQQIRDALFAKETFNEADFLEIALDNRALFLTRWYKQLLAEVQSPTFVKMPAAETVRHALQDWSGKADATSKAHLAVSRFRDQFHAHTLGRIYTEAASLRPDQTETRLVDEYALWTLLSQKPDNALLPDQPNWDAVVKDVLDALADEITDEKGELMSWGEHNHLQMEHPFSTLLPALKPWLSMPKTPLSGDSYMPNVLRSTGPNVSERMLIAPGHENSAVLHMPGGQAGHPMSPYWGAGHEDWVKGALSPLRAQEERWKLRFNPS